MQAFTPEKKTGMFSKRIPYEKFYVSVAASRKIIAYCPVSKFDAKAIWESEKQILTSNTK